MLASADIQAELIPDFSGEWKMLWKLYENTERIQIAGLVCYMLPPSESSTVKFQSDCLSMCMNATEEKRNKA